MKTLWTVIRHNSFLAVSLCIVSAALLWIYGCESMTKSLKYPGVQVNRAELMLELENIISESHIRISELDRQDEFKEALFNIAVLSAESGTINPISVALTLGNMLGFAAVIDNRRKDTVIKTLKTKNNVPVKPV